MLLFERKDLKLLNRTTANHKLRFRRSERIGKGVTDRKAGARGFAISNLTGSGYVLPLRIAMGILAERDAGVKPQLDGAIRIPKQ